MDGSDALCWAEWGIAPLGPMQLVGVLTQRTVWGHCTRQGLNLPRPAQLVMVHPQRMAPEYTPKGWCWDSGLGWMGLSSYRTCMAGLNTPLMDGARVLG